MPNLQLLLVEDNPLDAELTRARLETANLQADTTLVDNETDFIAQLSARTFDAILADYMLPQFTGAEALDIARRMAPQTPFIFVSGALGEEHAVDMLKRGATDYVIKQRLQRLPVVLLRALAEAAERRQRIAAEAALREAETHFRLLINALKEHAVLSLDPQGIVRTWNAASRSILGYAREDILGKSAEILYPQAAREAGEFQRKLERVRREGSLTDDRWMLRKDGTPFYAGFPFDLASRRWRSFISYGTDKPRLARRITIGSLSAASSRASGLGNTSRGRTSFLIASSAAHCAAMSRPSTASCAAWACRARRMSSMPG